MALLTPKELCAHLKISRSSLARLQKAGLPGIGSGRLRRFDLDSSLRWYAQFSNRTPAPGLLFVGAYACQKCHYTATISEPTDATRLQECPQCGARKRLEKVDAPA